MVQIGDVIDGKYKILNKIGQGGMSVVYLAMNERANKMWAVKVLKKEVFADFPQMQHGLLSETNILKNLHHKYLPGIADIIEDNDDYLIVMDYVEGKTLLECMGDAGCFTVEAVVKIGIQLCEVLHYLHTRENPVIYRDMKPSNIMLKPDGDITLIDFGTARTFKNDHFEDTTCLGTPGYAAPEQYGGHGQTVPQTDIYSLGATLHHLLTGRNPSVSPFCFPPITKCCPELLSESSGVCRDTVLGLEIIIDKCTKQDVDARYKSCAELKYDLERAQKLGLPYRRKLKQRLRCFLLITILTVLSGAACGISTVLVNYLKYNGYDYYMENAATAPNGIEMYQKAIALAPDNEAAYVGLLDMLVSDTEGFTAADDQIITDILYSKTGGRSMDHKTCLQQNEQGYIYFAYKMGCIYYTVDETPGSKASAAPWFQVIENADMEHLIFKADVDKKEMAARAKILGRICNYYKNETIGQVDVLGDSTYAYGDYWSDLMSLLEADTAAQTNNVLELRFYNEIVYQVYTHGMAFKVEAGLTNADMYAALDLVKKKVTAIDSVIGGVLDLKKEVLENIERAWKNVDTVFAENAVAVMNDSVSQGGNDG